MKNNVEYIRSHEHYKHGFIIQWACSNSAVGCLSLSSLVYKVRVMDTQTGFAATCDRTNSNEKNINICLDYLRVIRQGRLSQ